MDKLPTKTTEKIWRWLIDRGRLAHALDWLKKNNPLYYAVAVELAEFVDPEIHISPGDDVESDELPEIETKSMLQHEPDKFQSSTYTTENVIC